MMKNLQLPMSDNFQACLKGFPFMLLWTLAVLTILLIAGFSYIPGA